MASPTCPTCGVRMREHEAGRCLNAWVDRIVFGTKLKLVDAVRINGRWHQGRVWLYEDEDPTDPAAGCSPAGRTRPFSTDIAAAWQVWTAVLERNDGSWTKFCSVLEALPNVPWAVDILAAINPLSISQAAILALSEGEDG